MADYTNLKQQIAAAIRANGEGAITGPLLQTQLLDIVDAMEVDTFGGFIADETVPPADSDKPHVFLAITPGYYEAFDLTVTENDVWLVCRMADEDEWTKTNLVAGLKEAIASKQGALTEGDGISIDSEGNISVKTGNGLVVNDEGEIEVETTDEPQTYPTLPVSGKGVTDYIDTEKGLTIAELDAEGKVKAEQMPDDVVYFEETTDPSDQEVIDEYARLLDELYQAIDDVAGLMAEEREATQTALNAASTANTAAVNAAAATRNAERATQEADEAIYAARQAIANVNDTIHNSNMATQQALNAANGANQAANRCSVVEGQASAAAENANNKALLAEQKAGLADDAATLANQKAELADTKAQYADQMGDYAKGEIDGAKGDYESLDARFDHVDEIAIYFEETETPSDEQLVDEYRRVLLQAYQCIDDMLAAINDCGLATAAANTAAQNTLAAIQQALDAKTTCDNAAAAANDAAALANTKAQKADLAADAAIRAMDAAKGDYGSLAARLDAIQAKLEQAVYFEDTL